MKTKVYEKDIENGARTYALTLGFLCFKFESPGNNGVPDRIFINPNGITIYIEFKAPGKLATYNQGKQIKRIKANLAPVFVADNLEMACQILDAWKDRVDVRP